MMKKTRPAFGRPRRSKETGQANITLLGWSSGLLVLQPPLPLQEFWPLQPLSPALQPPVPLQLFWPLQSCLPASLEASFDESPLPALSSAYAREAMDPA